MEKVLPQALPADIVIVNPPRTGMHADACAALGAMPPARMLYISCDPATLARDAARLQGTFTVSSIRCFDMFPQTAHIETVLELRCVTS
jgi:23S rRNA (uracil1939-C5)-methyltransferase